VASLVRAGALQGFPELVLSLGGDPDRLLARHGIESLVDPEALVSLEATTQLLEEAATELACPDFGLRLGRRQTPEVLGILAVVILNAPTVRRALADASRYLFVHSPAYEVVVDDSSPLGPDCSTIRFGVQLDDFSPQRQLVDGCLAVTFEFARLIGPSDFALRAVSLPHTPVASRRTYREYFEAPVHFEQPYAGLHVQRHLLETDLRPASAALRAMALQHILQTYDIDEHTAADRVRHALTRTMGMIRGTKSEIAALLSLHPRTLQRRLDELGTSFETIRDEVYRTTASRYLRETDLALAQVAAAMGYSEHSAFTRACHRWFGRAASAVRREAMAEGNPQGGVDNG
jgi:AraC-like DNA-binding protein